MRNRSTRLSVSRIEKVMRRIKESGLRIMENLRVQMTRRMQHLIRNLMQLIEDMDLSLRSKTRVMAGSLCVGLRGADPGSELFTPTNKTLTIGPFGNNLHSACCSLTRSSIGGC